MALSKAAKLWLWLGGGLTAVLVGVGVYEEAKSKPAAAPSGTQYVSLVQGHRFSLTFGCPTTAATPKISALSGVNVVSTSPNASGTGGTIVFDYVGTTGSYPVVTAGCSITLVDDGPTPTTPVGVVQHPPVVQQGGQGGAPSGGSQFNANQSVSVLSGQSAAAHAQAGTLKINTQWAIVSIAPSPAYSGSPSFFGNSATLTLTGQPGTITLTGTAGQGQGQAPVSKVVVS
jgi:hypothetical protein